jgi:hypothetical protein
MHQQHQPLLEDGERLDIGVGIESKGERKIAFVAAQRGDCLAPVANLHLEIDQWVTTPERCKRRRKESGRCRLTGNQPDPTAAQSLQILDRRSNLVECCAALANILQEQLAGCGEPHAARQPLEDGGTQLLFDVEQAPVDGRCRHMKPLGRLADRPAASHFVKVTQVTEVIHLNVLSLPKRQHV